MKTSNLKDEREALLPCPFCGYWNCSLSLRAGAWKFAYCPDCLTEGPARDSDSDAIAAWNTRATQASEVEQAPHPFLTWQQKQAISLALSFLQDKNFTQARDEAVKVIRELLDAPEKAYEVKHHPEQSDLINLVVKLQTMHKRATGMKLPDQAAYPMARAILPADKASNLEQAPVAYPDARTLERLKANPFGGYAVWGSPCDGYDVAIYAAPGAPTAEQDKRDAEVEQFLSEVRTELIRARSKFPGDRIMTIALAEEFGELCKAVLDESAANVRKEAIQTAVMCARVVLDGDGSVVAWREERGLDALAATAQSEGES
ncbi:Lar family restriction alleviation protein [Paraburkholderia sp. PREW-6R]|uniref:Lar family restriction alleviation protein n=1 Tax=Paraburkholderia sp. PREW-6R TaxID=3141544 RepID=UPI0031F4A94E